MRPAVAFAVLLLFVAPLVGFAPSGAAGADSVSFQEEDGGGEGDGEEDETPTPTPEPTATPTPEPTESSESDTESPTPADSPDSDTEATESSADSNETDGTSDDETDGTEPSDSDGSVDTDSTDGSGDSTETEDAEVESETEDAEPTETPEPDGGERTPGSSTVTPAVAAERSPGFGSGLDVDSEAVGAGAAVGVGALTTGVLARRYLEVGGGGTGLTRTTASAVAGSPSPRYAASELASRARRALSDGWYRVLGLAGYTKWAGEEPLEHETREALYDHVQTDPGTYLSAFEDAPGVEASFGSIRYHLDILEREGLVTAEKHRGKKRYYPVGSSPDALSLALESESTRRVLEALAESPAGGSELAERLGLDPSTVSHHLSNLESDGLVEREREGQSVTNRLTPGVRSMLDREAESATAPATGD